ncbi:MAG: GNAT family N-acetyltransferase [Chthoniobacterales bacterium]
MLDDTAVSFAEGTAKILRLADLQSSECWKRAFAGRCKDNRYYEIVERTLANEFEYRYLLLEDCSGKARAVQPVFFVRQDLLEGVPKFRRIVDLVRKMFPRFLTMRILMVGCAAGAAELGACEAEDEVWVARALRDVLPSHARQNKASLIVFKDFPAKYRPTLSILADAGFTRVPSMPMTRLSLEHGNFDAYLQTIGYITRKSLRRKFRKTEHVAKIDMGVITDISPHVDEAYPLYLAVHERSPMQFEHLTKEFFCAVGREMPDKARFFVWRQSGRIIAFSLCLVCGDTIYDEYLGLDYGVALDLHLYFYTMRDVLIWAIGQRLRWYYSGPLNYDPKLHLRHELAPLDLYVRHTRAWLNPLFRFALKFLEPTRHDPVLRQFPNADQL